MARTPKTQPGKLHLDVLPEAQRRLWDELGSTPGQFVRYGDQFSPMVTLKALSYFGEPELAALPTSVKNDLAMAAGSVDREVLPKKIARLLRSAS